MPSIKTFYISIDGDIYEIAYNSNLYTYKDVVKLINYAINDFKNDHDMWSWDEELSTKLKVTELSNLPYGQKIAFSKTLDPDMDDEDLIEEDNEDESDIDDCTNW